MSGIDLDAIRARAEAATEGPWAFHDFGYAGEQEPSSIVIHTGQFDHADLREYESETAIAWMPRWEAQESDNAEFIAHAREDIPALLAEIERLRDDRDEQGRFLSTVDEFARVSAMSHDAVLEAVGVKADLDRAEAALARVRKLADSWDRTRGENHRLAAGWLRAAIEGTDS